MLRRTARWIIQRLAIPLLDSLILWAFGWRKVRVPGIGCGPHYADPKDGRTLYLRDYAVVIACGRARASAQHQGGGDE